MVTEKQKRKIKTLMADIKRAKNNGEDERVIKERTNELISYLEKEGLLDRFNG